MEQERKLKVLSVFRSHLLENRGTPLRVKSLISHFRGDVDLEWHTCTLDRESPLGLPHISIMHDHLYDIRKIASYAEKNNINVLIFHSVAAAFYLPFLKLLMPRKKFVLEMHGFREEESLLYGSISKFTYNRDRLFYSVIYRLANLITTCSETASQRMRKYNKNVVTVYGGFDPVLFNSHVSSGNFIQRNAEDIIVGYAGDGRKWQGLPFLLDAFDKLVQLHPKFKLALLLSENRKIPERPYIQVLGALPHDMVARFTVDCDILVIPRIHSPVNELGYPSKLMEYMAMGKPVVGSRTSDIHKIIRSGENGVLFNPEDVEGFIEATSSLTEKEVRKTIGKRAEETAFAGFTWEIQGALFKDAIFKIGRRY